MTELCTFIPLVCCCCCCTAVLIPPPTDAVVGSHCRVDLLRTDWEIVRVCVAIGETARVRKEETRLAVEEPSLAARVKRVAPAIVVGVDFRSKPRLLWPCESVNPSINLVVRFGRDFQGGSPPGQAGTMEAVR